MVAYMHSLIYNVASRATCFAVSVPAQEFYFSPTPQVYIQNVTLGSRLQAKYFHIYTCWHKNVSMRLAHSKPEGSV